MEMKKSEVLVNKQVAAINSSVVVECDTIVPDSKPDLLKILQIDADVKILSKEITDNNLNLKGIINYQILYVPDSAKGVCSLTTSSAFNHIEDIPGINERMFMSVTCDVEHIEFNLLNSRKLSIKTVVATNSTITNKISLDIPTDIDGECIEIKKQNFRTLCRVIQKETDILIDESLLLPPGKPTISSILKNDVTVRNKDIKIIAGKVVAKGEVAICSLYIPEGSDAVTFVEHSIPFTEILDAEGINDDYYNNVRFDVESSDFALSSDSDGDMRVIDTNIKIKVYITSDEIINSDVIMDSYSTACNLEVKSSYFEVDELICNLNTNTTIKENITPIEGIPPILHIYNIVAKPYITTAVANDGRITIEGSIDTYILYISSKEDSPVYNFKADVPFNLNIDLAAADLDNVIRATLDVNHISYNLNAAGEIEMRIVLNADVAAFKTIGVDIISEIEETEFTDKDSPSIVLYFVQKDDTLWDIAKRYHTKSNYIEDLNEFDTDSLQEGKQLLIPKG